MRNLPLQLELRPELPNIYGHADYREFRDTLVKIDEILYKSGLEDQLVDQALQKWCEKHNKGGVEDLGYKEATFHWQNLKYALRCNIARGLTGESFRVFGVRLADSELLQWFTSINAFGKRKAVSKSSLERYSKTFNEDIVEVIIKKWQADFLTDEQCVSKIGLNEPVKFNDLFIDSACVKTNIHFPVDWILLRDATRSLLLAIKTIRAQGLKNRMIEPKLFMRQMNKLCIEMTHIRRRPDSKKQRKKILRKMKKLSKVIEKHGVRYKNLLNERWMETDWTMPQVEQVIARIDNVLEQLPAAIKQAHERIIGGRRIPNNKKILSLYEPDIHVIVRGKTGSEVEFGNTLLLGEQINGLIVDWKLFRDQAPHDSKLLEGCVQRVSEYHLVESTCTDRGFFSRANQKFLEQENIYDAMCPKNPKALRERLQEPTFLALQTRRSQTEARIGIFKNVFLGRPLRSKGFSHRNLSVTWCVLTHNLWVIARMALADEQSLKKAA
jgi:hypothetical protein